MLSTLICFCLSFRRRDNKLCTRKIRIIIRLTLTLFEVDHALLDPINCLSQIYFDFLVGFDFAVRQSKGGGLSFR